MSTERRSQSHSQHTDDEDPLSTNSIDRATSPSNRPQRTKTPTPSHPHPQETDVDVADLDIDEQQLLAETGVRPDLHHKVSRGTLSHFLTRRRSQHVKGQRREKVRMVGQHLHDHLHNAFKSWFRDTESDGSPILPAPLSRKYNVQSTVLGQGSFAVVKAVTEKSSGTERALKIIAKKPLKENSEKMLKEEIKILGKVEHPNVIKMWDLYETKEGVFIVTDLCRGGELFDRLVEKVHYNELDARHIMKQIFEGVQYLHEQDIIHRDLKPENILLRDKSDPSDIVISDFGLSRFIPEEGLLMTACGSPQYVSPEVLLGRGYGPAVDVWSSGVIAYCLLAGYTPFYGEDQPTLFQEIVKSNVEFEPQYWSDISDTAKDFILKCLCPAEERMTAAQALQHPWLANLPPVHAEEHRGACLKDKAKKHLTARQRMAGAVTAVEAINYLQRLHTLRQEHSQSLPPDELSKLLRAATHLHISSGQLEADPSLANDPEVLKSISQETVRADEHEEDQRPQRKQHKDDSAMSLEMVVMPSFGDQPNDRKRSAIPFEMVVMPGFDGNDKGDQKPDEADQASDLPVKGRPGTEAMAAEIEASEGGPSGVPRSARSSSVASTVRPASPGASSVNSDTTARPGDDAPRKPRSSSRGAATGKNGFGSVLTTILDQRFRGEEIPESARTIPSAEQVEREPMSIKKAWSYVPFLISQGYTIGSAVASHAIYGPPKKSWGIEMSVFTKLLRETANYTQFATVDGMQRFFELASFLPVPKDGLITPVTFRVKKRGLKGFLAESDAAEDGKRELTGEWVVGKQTWRRLQAEWRNGASKGTERVILYIHGGAYFVMSAVTHRPVTISLSKYTDCRVFAVNYRLAPGAKFPGPLHDVVASWFRLTSDLGINPNNIVLGGDSAGGGLVCALLLYLRDNNYPLPSGAILFSPWVDLTMSCDSWETNSEFDYLSVPASHDHMNPVRAYLGDNVNKYLTHPYASPLFGDFRGMPPMLIQCGDAEVLRDEVTLLAHKCSLAGVAVRHELYEDCVHVFQAFLFLDASRKALQSARHFVRTALDRRTKRKSEVTRDARQQMDKEMRENMGDSRGEKVEPRTGTRKGSWRDGKSESDTELEPRDETDEDWELDEEGKKRRSVTEDQLESAAAREASKLQPANVVGKVLGASDSSVTKAENSDLQHTRSQSHEPATIGRNFGSSVSGMLPISIEEAQSRAQAGMRAQESSNAPALARFHDPTATSRSSLKPKMRRQASNAAIQSLMDQYDAQQLRGDASPLHTKVFTPGAGASGSGSGSGSSSGNTGV